MEERKQLEDEVMALRVEQRETARLSRDPGAEVSDEKEAPLRVICV